MNAVFKGQVTVTVMKKSMIYIQCEVAQGLWADT